LKFFYLVHSKTFLNPGFISSSFLLGHSKGFYRVFSLVFLKVVNSTPIFTTLIVGF